MKSRCCSYLLAMGGIAISGMVAVAVAVFLMLTTGCVMHAPLRLLSPNLSRARSGLYESWHKENRAAYEAYPS